MAAADTLCCPPSIELSPPCSLQSAPGSEHHDVRALLSKQTGPMVVSSANVTTVLELCAQGAQQGLGTPPRGAPWE